jgi:hypothetical protein
MGASPTTEQLQRAVGVICKVIGQIPYYHIYEHSLAHVFDTSDQVGESLKAMSHNAALDSTLLNVRCFNEFFKPGGRRDDVRAYHFPGVAMQPFLTPEQELEIHKHLAHITLDRTNIEAKPWTIDGFIGVGLRHGIQFLDHIDRSFPLPTDHARAEVRDVSRASALVIQSLFNRHENEA